MRQFFQDGNKRDWEKIGTDSVTPGNLVVRGGRSFLLKISVSSWSKAISRRQEEHKTRSAFGMAVWRVSSIPAASVRLMPFLLHGVPTSANPSAAIGWEWFTPLAVVGGEKCSVMSKSQQRMQLSSRQSPCPRSAVTNVARDQFTAFCNPWRAREAASECFAC